MDYVIFFLIVLLIGVAVAISRACPTARPWQRALADELGLRMDRILSLNSPGWRLHGSVDGLDVVVELRDQDAEGSNARASVDVHGSIPRSLVLQAEGAWQQVEKAAMGTDIEAGDTEFDAKVNVRGVTAEALAVLTEPARRAVAELTGEVGGRVSDGAVRCDGDVLVRDSRPLVSLLRQMLAVARFLGLEQDGVAPRLRSNAALDPDPGVRLRNLQALTRDFRGSDVALEAAETALADPDNLLRLFGALAIAAEPVDSNTSDRLDRALTTLRELRDAPTGPKLVELVGNESLEVAWGAATALGLVGSAAEVEPLLGRARGLLTDSRLKQAVNSAVERIQSRLGDVEPGRLSLAQAEATAGGLSLAAETDEAGALSLTAQAPRPRDRS